jgi:hypothetical protein
VSDRKTIWRPFSEKLKKVIGLGYHLERFESGPYVDGFISDSLGYLGFYVKNRLCKGTFEAFNEDYLRLISMLRRDFEEKRYDEAFDHLNGIEIVLNVNNSDELKELGNGCIKVHLLPPSSDFPTDVEFEYKGKRYGVAAIEFDFLLKKDQVIFTPMVPGEMQ